MASLELHVLPNRWSTTRPPGTGRPSFGHRQEARIRRGLEGNPDFKVMASADLDYLQKLDCVVEDVTRSELGPVGLQITTRDNDSMKIERTFQALKKTRPVPRAIYVIVAGSAGAWAIPAIAHMIRKVAAWPRQGMVVIRLRRTGDGVLVQILNKMVFDAQVPAA